MRKLIFTILALALAGTTWAVPAELGPVEPTFMGGNPNPPPGFGPPDDSADRIDPNVSTSPYAGVVSIFIDFDTTTPGGFICSGAMISPWHVMSAGHCVDEFNNGVAIDLNDPNALVLVLFNSDGTDNARIAADKVTIHPDYEGFGPCPMGVAGFCVNDDISILRLSEKAPDTATVYELLDSPVGHGTQYLNAGYGVSGNGISGDAIGANFFVKHIGGNTIELFDGNDEGDFFFDTNNDGTAEVHYADFDGIINCMQAADDLFGYPTDCTGADDPTGIMVVDSFCFLFGLSCTDVGGLGNAIETGGGGGDSGSGVFISHNGSLFLIGNNTFGSVLPGFNGNPGGFGAFYGGILLFTYLEWFRETAVPAPGTLALLGLGLLGLGITRRRKV